MKIVVVGAGKIGFTLTQYLTREGHDVTVIDRNPDRIGMINTTLDAISISGPVDIELLRLAGADKADLLIAATNSDESNILCCMMGRKLGSGHTIARVRQQDHYDTVMLLRAELSPISLCLTFQCADVQDGDARGTVPEFTGFRMKDGTVCTGLHGGSTHRMTPLDSNVRSSIIATGKVIDADQVESLLFLRPGAQDSQSVRDEDIWEVRLESL